MIEPNNGQPVAGASQAGATSLSLLSRIKANDTAAWSRMVALYAPLVYYWCRKLDLPEQDTDDIFQDVFQSVAMHIATFRKEQPSDTFRGWLRTITRNKIHDHFRRLGRHPQAAGGSDAHRRLAELPSPAIGEEDHEERRAFRLVTQRALESIRGEFTPRTWQAFWRVTVDGQRPVDVALELAMRPGAIRVAKSRVLRRLRQELGDLLD